MSGGSSGGGGDQTTKSEPWDAQKPYLEYLFKQARKQFKGKDPKFYPGQMTAEFTPVEREAQRSALNFARAAPGQARDASEANRFLLQDALHPSSNPALQETIKYATDPIARNFTENIMPAIGADAFSAGLVGSNRQGIAEGLAAGETQRAIGGESARIANEAYNSGLDAMVKGIGLAPQTQQMGMAGTQALSAVGAQQRAYEQALLDEAVQRYTYNQNVPFDKLAQYQQLIQGGYGGTATTMGAGGGQNPLLGALGGGMTGLAAGSMLFPGTAWAAPAMGGAMALMNLFG